MNILGKLLAGISAFINAIACLVLIISSYSDLISPAHSTLFPLLGLFFPVFLLGNVMLCLLWLLLRRWKIALMNGVTFLICISAIMTYIPINIKTRNIPEDCIKVVTYNVMRFNHLEKNAQTNKNAILEFLKDSDADIICLQEFGASVGNKKNQLSEKEIKEALKALPHFHFQELLFPHKELFGMALFSKYPILSVKKIPYESHYNSSFIVELDINGKRVTLVNNHLESNKLSVEDRTNYVKFTQDVGSESLHTFAKTIFQRLRPAYKIRAQQADIISETIAEYNNPYVIVCGDFNDTPVSYARHKIKGDLKDAFVESGNGLGITYNRHRFYFRIDYILHSKNIKSYNCTVGKLRDSDHYPVSCYLQLKD